MMKAGGSVGPTQVVVPYVNLIPLPNDGRVADGSIGRYLFSQRQPTDGTYGTGKDRKSTRLNSSH